MAEELGVPEDLNDLASVTTLMARRIAVALEEQVRVVIDDFDADLLARVAGEAVAQDLLAAGLVVRHSDEVPGSPGAHTLRQAAEVVRQVLDDSYRVLRAQYRGDGLDDKGQPTVRLYVEARLADGQEFNANVAVS